MNVLFVALGIHSREGGIERFNRRVVECLATGRVRHAHVVALWDAPHAAPAGVVFTGCGESKPRALRAFVRALRRDRPDVVLYGHVLLAPLAVLARLLRRRARNVLIAHGYEVWDRPSRPRRLVTDRTVDFVASVSDYTAARMAAAYGMDEDRFVRVINAVDAAEPPPRRATQGHDLVCVSRLNPLDKAKHVDEVIRAMPAVLARFPDARLHVVGDGAWRPELEALARSLGLDDNVSLLGTVSDDEREVLYAGAGVFVLPSTQEGFGIVYLEAWRHRLPVVAGAGGAAPEVVAHEETGLVVEPSPAVIAGAIVRLLEDRDLARRLGEAGHERLLRSYTGPQFDEAFSAMLERVAAP